MSRRSLFRRSFNMGFSTMNHCITYFRIFIEIPSVPLFTLKNPEIRIFKPERCNPLHLSVSFGFRSVVGFHRERCNRLSYSVISCYVVCSSTFSLSTNSLSVLLPKRNFLVRHVHQG